MAEAYLRRGLLARVRIRSIAVAEGVAEVSIEELQLGRVHLDIPEGARVTADLAERFLTGRLSEGGACPSPRSKGAWACSTGNRALRSPRPWTLAPLRARWI